MGELFNLLSNVLNLDLAISAGRYRKGCSEWRGCGNGVGAGTGTSFRDNPSPRLSRKGALRAGSSIIAPLRDNRGGGGGGLSRKGVLSSLPYQPFYKIVLIFFLSFF